MILFPGQGKMGGSRSWRPDRLPRLLISAMFAWFRAGRAIAGPTVALGPDGLS